MSRRGNCWDNAPQESFFGHLKDSVKTKICKTFEELKRKIDKYIIYYNNYRYKWDLKKMTPVQYRNHLYALNTLFYIVLDIGIRLIKYNPF
ncbi:transposase InsO family protein [Clostridium beijerinckii]|nr:transposase InsO family protein [Clostridium beijerinckii]